MKSPNVLYNSNFLHLSKEHSISILQGCCTSICFVHIIFRTSHKARHTGSLLYLVYGVHEIAELLSGCEYYTVHTLRLKAFASFQIILKIV